MAVLLSTGCGDDAPSANYEQRIMQERVERDMQMREKSSVLAPDWRDGFQGLNYYAVDSTYRFTSTLQRHATPDTMMLAENTGRLQAQARVGHVVVPLPQGNEQLAVFRGAGDNPRGRLWVPFADATNGDATYKAGRYVDLRRHGEDSVIVDFNRAYNPTCVYNPDYACPLPPERNRIDAPIPAGERVPKFADP